jgi:hypothetical protein
MNSSMPKYITLIFVCALFCNSCYKKKPKPGEYTMQLEGYVAYYGNRSSDTLISTTVFIRESNKNEIIIENVVGEISTLSKHFKSVKGTFKFNDGTFSCPLTLDGKIQFTSTYYKIKGDYQTETEYLINNIPDIGTSIGRFTIKPKGR